MINLNKICVYDFETDGVDTEVCNPVELAAVMIDPRKMEIIPSSEFHINIRPDDIVLPSYYEDHRDTIDFHSKVLGISHDEVLAKWQQSIPLEKAWLSFYDYTSQYHTNPARKTKFTAPIPAGHNIDGFDSEITERLNQRFKITNMFHCRDKIDTLTWSFFWFENQLEPKKLNFDAIREHVGFSKEGAHTALQDVKQIAQYIIKLFNLHRKVAAKVKWK
jgi:DNA polymerase III alpha subunit (gram-positive type)